MTEPDPTPMAKYCAEILPALLSDACGVDAGLAGEIAQDVKQRAEAFAMLSDRAQDVLMAPFVEEVFDHRPWEAELGLKAKVTVVVHNSVLEQAHHDGPLGSGIVAITEYAAAPFSHFLAARRRKPIDYRGPNRFAGLHERYPRAWACLDAITDASLRVAAGRCGFLPRRFRSCRAVERSLWCPPAPRMVRRASSVRSTRDSTRAWWPC